ncbi:hypothetical protein C8J56DRAFT_940533 [Mycena floridula]|nr:hypothetical protein C8J56DRAFT_940533 [Mycena floridula]
MSAVLCRYFLLGACKNQNNCTFRHDRESASISSNSRIQCHFFLQGQCLRTDCKFLHETRDISTAPVACSPGACQNGELCSNCKPDPESGSGIVASSGESPDMLSPSETVCGQESPIKKEVVLDAPLPQGSDGWIVRPEPVLIDVESVQEVQPVIKAEDNASVEPKRVDINPTYPHAFYPPPTPQPNYSSYTPYHSNPFIPQTFNLIPQPLLASNSGSWPFGPRDDSAPLCQPYLRGFCELQKTNQCQMRHYLTEAEIVIVTRLPSNPVASGSSPVSSPSRPICAFYQSGRCKNGVACAFLHEVVAVNDEQPRTSFKTLPCKFFPTGSCKLGSACTYSHDLETNTTIPSIVIESSPAVVNLPLKKSSKPCNFYAEGRCKKGNDCLFTHYETEPKAKTDVEVQEEDNGWGVSTDAATWGVTDVDDPWGEAPAASSSSSFRESSSSSWDHPTPARHRSPRSFDPPRSGRPPRKPPSTSRCPWLVKNGECLRGEACPHSHDSETLKPQTPEQTWTISPSSPASPVPITSDAWGESGSHDPWGDDDVEQGAVEEEQVEDPGQSQDDDSATWGTAQWKDPAPVAGPSRIDKPCLAYGQGFCRFGSSCRFRHISQDGIEEEVPEQSGVYDDGNPESPDDFATEPEVIETSFFRCDIRIGPGATTEQIATMFDSSTLLISDLSPSIADEDILDLCQPFGTILDMSRDMETESLITRVDFVTCQDAAEAARHLNNREYQSATISARLDSASITQNNVSSTVKLTWLIPVTTAWARFKFPSQAKATAAKINDTVFMGRKITAQFETSRKNAKNDPYPGIVNIQNLPADTVDADIQVQLCPEAALVARGQVTYTNSPVDQIHGLISTYGDFDSLDVVHTDKAKTKALAFARFTTREAAVAAVAGLDQVNHKFLGDTPIRLQLVHSIRYTLPKAALAAVREELDRVSEAQSQCKINHYHNADSGQSNSRVRLSATEASQLKAVIDQVEPTVRGKVLYEGDKIAWDDILETASGQKIIAARINQKDKSYVLCDFRTHSIRIFGSEEDRSVASKALLRMLQQAREQRRFEALTGSFRTAVLNGGLDAFRAANQGQEWKVSLDFSSEICTVFGTPEFQNNALETIKGFMPTDPLESGGDFCTLCCVETGRLPVKLGCGHSYCNTCLQMFLLSAAGPKFSRLTCLAKSEADGQAVSCPFPIPLTIIRRLLLATEQGDLWESSFVAYIRDHP